MKLTKWYSSEQKPVHEGIYETKFAVMFSGGYSYWNGVSWGNEFDLKEDCHWNEGGVQRKKWRGLAIKPKEGA